MTTHERIIERIRKLLALSRSSNVHEAKAAAEKAQELLQKYKLDRCEVELMVDEIDIGVQRFPYAARVIPWQRDLAFAVARGFFCRAVHTPLGKTTAGRSWLYFVGRPEDIEVARAVFEHLRRELKRLAIEAYRADRRLRSVARDAVTAPRIVREWQHSFFAGAAWGLDGRFREGARMFHGAHMFSGAIARRTSDAIERTIAENFRPLDAPTRRRTVRAYSGWVAGFEAALNMEPREPQRLEVRPQGEGRLP